MEYEDRRDADDAYHDMHNKRIGRDDILKIEVGLPLPSASRAVLTHLIVGPHSSLGFVAVRPQRPGPGAAPLFSPPPLPEPAPSRVLAPQG